VWQSQATILVTDPGFPWGDAVQGYVKSGHGSNTPAVPVGDTTRLSALAALYSQFANSDDVLRIMLGGHKAPGHAKSVAAVVTPAFGSTVPALPLVSFTGTADSAKLAIWIARRQVQGLLDYVQTQQAKAQIPDDRRVVVKVLNRAEKATILKGRKKTLPIIVFLAVMVAVTGLAFALENLRPRVRVVAGKTVPPVREPHAAAARRTA
jgi:hypothetical protein